MKTWRLIMPRRHRRSARELGVENACREWTPLKKSSSAWRKSSSMANKTIMNDWWLLLCHLRTTYLPTYLYNRGKGRGLFFSPLSVGGFLVSSECLGVMNVQAHSCYNRKTFATTLSDAAKRFSSHSLDSGDNPCIYVGWCKYLEQALDILG